MNPFLKRLLWAMVGLVLLISLAPSVASSATGALVGLAALAVVVFAVVGRGVKSSRPGSNRGARRFSDLASYEWRDTGVGLVLGFAVGEVLQASPGAAVVAAVVVAGFYRFLPTGLNGIVLLVVGGVGTIVSLSDLFRRTACVPRDDAGAVLLAVTASVAVLILVAVTARRLFHFGGGGFGRQDAAAGLLIVFALVELAQFAFNPAAADILSAQPWLKVLLVVLAVALALLISANAEVVLGVLGLGLVISQGWLALVEYSLLSDAAWGFVPEYCLGGPAPVLCAFASALVIGVGPSDRVSR